MKKGTLISIIIALIAVAGALLGLVAYMRSRRCLECGNVEEDYIPETEGDYDAEYFVDDSAQPVDMFDVDQTSNYISAPISEEDLEDLEDLEDITE